MAIRTWKFQSGKRGHVVVLEHNPWSGRRVLKLDGNEMMNEMPWDNLRHSYKFACDKLDCEVTVGRSYLVLSVKYTFTVGGILVEPDTGISDMCLLHPCSPPAESTLLQPASTSANGTNETNLLRADNASTKESEVL